MSLTTGHRPHRLFATATLRRTIVLGVAAAALAAVPGASPAQLRRQMPDSLSDREFWQMFTTLSEESGSFPSENFVSNELTYQNVIPTLQRALTPGGVYLGVGPEQNFTYIANLKPRMAVIFDIRRQNAMAHLMYKALFELSPTRADVRVAAVLATAAAPRWPTGDGGDAVRRRMRGAENDSAFDANRRAIVDQLTSNTDSRYAGGRFARSGTSIERSLRPVRTSTTDIGWLAGPVRPTYSTYAQVQTFTNAEGVEHGVPRHRRELQWLRTLETKNLVVPVVGNFAGPEGDSRRGRIPAPARRDGHGVLSLQRRAVPVPRVRRRRTFLRNVERSRGLDEHVHSVRAAGRRNVRNDDDDDVRWTGVREYQFAQCTRRRQRRRQRHLCNHH